MKYLQWNTLIALCALSLTLQTQAAQTSAPTTNTTPNTTGSATAPAASQDSVDIKKLEEKYWTAKDDVHNSKESAQAGF